MPDPHTEQSGGVGGFGCVTGVQETDAFECDGESRGEEGGMSTSLGVRFQEMVVWFMKGGNWES